MKVNTEIKRRIQTYIWSFFWTNYQLPELSIDEILDTYKKYEPTLVEDICLPPYHGNHDFNDYSILISLIKAIVPTKILELGTAHGNTVANICVECDAQVFTVNALPEQMEGNIITFTLDKNEIGIIYRKNGFADRVVQIYENTKTLNILNYLSQKSVDFTFIDACHDAEFVVNDFQKILPALSDHAVVLFHDTHPSLERHLLDSYLGCMCLRMLGYDIKHITGSSLGYWSNQEPKIRSSFFAQIKNRIFYITGLIIYGNQEKFVKALRWLASGFLRGRFVTK